MLHISRRAFCREIAVEVTRSVYRADRYTLWVPGAAARAPALSHSSPTGATSMPACSADNAGDEIHILSGAT